MRAENVHENGDLLRLGAGGTALAWATYAVVECCFVGVIPWVLALRNELTPAHPWLSAALYLVYPLMGALLGGVFAVIVRAMSNRLDSISEGSPRRLVTAFGAYSLIIAFLVNIVGHWHFDPLLYAPLFIAIAIYTGIFFIYVLTGGSRDLTAFASPVAVSVILLGLPLVPASLLGLPQLAAKMILSLAYCAVIWGAAHVLDSLTARGTGGSILGTAWPRTRHAHVLLAVAGTVALALNFIHDQPPPTVQEVAEALSSATGKPNVVLITWDTVRADHVSLYGYERNTTPYLERFAEGATVFHHAIAPGDMTLSSHASIFTGLYPRAHEAHFAPPEFGEGRPLAQKFNTLTEHLAAAGYGTRAVVANYAYLTTAFGLDQGFHYHDVRAPMPILGKVSSYFLRRGVRDVIALFAPRRTYDTLYRTAQAINAEVTREVDIAAKAKQPFFLFINYMDAHDPYLPPPPFDMRYPGKDKRFNSKVFHDIAIEVMTGARSITKPELDHLNSQYDGAIAYLDDQLERLISILREHGVYDDSLIVLTSDHGEVFGDRDLFGHGVSVYQDQIHVPLIIKFPNQSEGASVDDVVSLVDLLPTVLEVTGIPVPEDLHGKSLVDYRGDPERLVISEHFTPEYALKWGERFRGSEHAAIRRMLKLIRSIPRGHELYDLTSDQYELTDLATDKEPLELRELQAELDKWLGSVTPEAGSATMLDSETIEALKALGYVK